MSTEDGGSAFPVKGGNIFYIPEQQSETVKGEIDRLKQAQDGMTLRDYFAAKALQAFIGTAPSATSFGVNHPETNLNYAKASYAMADAMLEAHK